MKPMLLLEIRPELLLFLGIVISLFLYWLFSSKKGLFVFLTKVRSNNRKIQLEDALKFLFDCEYKNIPCDIKKLSENLSVSFDHTSRLIEHLLSMGLVITNDQIIFLTDSGRSYALRIIRVHRIWEKYLADETGVENIKWHDQADRREHYISSKETEKLAAQMAHPVFDPHGDPIPTIDGEIPKQKGKPLSKLITGEIGHIIHIEDEPHDIYKQLLAQGLYLGMQVYVVNVSKEKITFAADGDECTLIPNFASQITVEMLSDEIPITSKYDILSTLNLGEKAKIIGISSNCRGQQRRRLMDLGIVPGSIVTAEMKSASGDPMGYRIMGTTIGIRRNQTDLIFIDKV